MNILYTTRLSFGPGEFVPHLDESDTLDIIEGEENEALLLGYLRITEKVVSDLKNSPGGIHPVVDTQGQYLVVRIRDECWLKCRVMVITDDLIEDEEDAQLMTVPKADLGTLL